MRYRVTFTRIARIKEEWELDWEGDEPPNDIDAEADGECISEQFIQTETVEDLHVEPIEEDQ